ncbi:uncharacterized protein LOC127248163 [Andrographis paniculata]|uniref:uncharacterized protein LOC127248163 n=1 Tax=Andrographis paniculata TaxID=175694 RepID=UPI0021E6F9AA|nr:uncharacterized protein LOC127248163 [Andrographis paniculata]
MAADVSSLIRLMNGGDAKESAKPTAPITRDLLGGSCGHDAQELDLDLQVPCGWEKRLDLKSGKVYLQRCNSSNSSSTSEQRPQSKNSTAIKLQDLNFPPMAKQQQQPLTLLEHPSLDLKLDSLSTAASPSSSNYQSVCTLDKVKSALARAEKETGRKRSNSRSLSISCSSPRSNSSSSIKDSEIDRHLDENSLAPVAAGCPSCLLYVLIPKNEPRCPRCNRDIPLPAAAPPEKKPRIDLNISI